MQELDVSIIIPIYNDSAKIGKTLETLVDFLNQENIKAEILVVSDGGKDDSAKIVREKMNRYSNICLIDRKQNRGKGYTVREGLGQAKGNFIFFTDADLPYMTEPIKKMLYLLKNNQADFVLANRDISAIAADKEPNKLRLMTHCIYSNFVRTLIPFEFSDTLAGLKCMNRYALNKIIQYLTIDRFSFDVELLLVAKKARLKIKEVPVSLKNVGKSNLSVSRDGPQMIKDVFKIWAQNKKGYYNV